MLDDHVPDIYDILPGFGEIQRYEGQPLEADLVVVVSRKSFHEVEELARGLGTMELFAGGRAVGIFLDESFRDLELTDALIDMVRFIDGIDIAVLLKAEDDKSCWVRMRSEVLDVCHCWPKGWVAAMLKEKFDIDASANLAGRLMKRWKLAREQGAK